MFTEPTVFVLGAGASWHYGYAASQQIHTIDGSDKVSDGDTLAKAKAAIAAAHRLYILGYGFDGNNNRRIGLDTLRFDLVSSDPKWDRTILFTNFGGNQRTAMAASRLMFGTPEKFLPPNPPIQTEQAPDAHTHRWEMSVKNVYDALNEDFESLETD